MSVFSRETIYEHMTTVHGGINDEAIIPERINYNEQEQVLQQAREARARERHTAGEQAAAGMPRAAQLEVQMQRGSGWIREDAGRAHEREMEAPQTRRMREADAVADRARQREAEARRARERNRTSGLTQTQNEAWERLRQRQTEAVPAQALLRHEFELEQEENRRMRTTGWCCGVSFLRGVMNFLRILVRDLEE